MKRTDLPKRFQDLLSRIPYATIATVCPDGQPWNTPMVAHFDDELNLYWLTNRFSQHVQNIKVEPRIFVGIYDSHDPDVGGTVDALYMQMRADILETTETIEEARKRSNMHFTDSLPNHQDFLGDCPRRFVKAVPIKIWHSIDIVSDNHTIDAREELTVQK